MVEINRRGKMHAVHLDYSLASTKLIFLPLAA